MTDHSLPGTTTQGMLAPLYLASMVCSMGMMGFVAAAGPLAALLGLQAWQIGLSATAGGVGWVLSARAWGRRADRTGRKPVLLIGLAGFTVGYVVLCLTVQAGTVWGLPAMAALTGLIVTRFAMGLSYSAVPAASAAVIADRFGPDERAGAMGRLGAAQASGLLFGPAFVAVFAGATPATILFLLALLPIPAFIFAAASLPKDRPKAGDSAAQLSLTDPRLTRLLVASMTAMTAVGIAQIVIGFIAMDRLGLPGEAAMRVAGFALTFVGVALVVAQLTVKRLGWSPAMLMRAGGSLAALGFTAAAFAPSEALLIAAYAFAGFGAGWAFPGFNAAAANAVSAAEQGRAAGAISSAMGVGAMLGPAIGGALYLVSGTASLLAGALGFAVTALLALGR